MFYLLLYKFYSDMISYKKIDKSLSIEEKKFLIRHHESLSLTTHEVEKFFGSCEIYKKHPYRKWFIVQFLSVRW